jgi:aspartate/methionine/tyrosine aminotransferase
MERLVQNAYICPSAPAQAAALAAFRPDTIAVLEERRAEFQRRRDFLVPALRALGFEIPVLPEGAFYVYADCSRLTQDSEQFALEVLERAGVAITPGRDFGTYRAGTHVRFAYTRSMVDLEQGVERLQRLLRAR